MTFFPCLLTSYFVLGALGAATCAYIALWQPRERHNLLPAMFTMFFAWPLLLTIRKPHQ